VFSDGRMAAVQDDDPGPACALSLFSFVVLMVVPAPYGRHVRSGWGPLISARVGWIAMEAPAVLVFAWAFLAGERWFHPAPISLFTLWQMHFVHRAFVFPFRTHGGKPMTLLVTALVALFVTATYGYLNGRRLNPLWRISDIVARGSTFSRGVARSSSSGS
jgi:3-oxo-5-alpha-steroid 4-dehydrogenase 1